MLSRVRDVCLQQQGAGPNYSSTFNLDINAFVGRQCPAAVADLRLA
jgi:hypothetical protein